MEMMMSGTVKDITLPTFKHMAYDHLYGLLNHNAAPCRVTLYEKMLEYKWVIRVTAPDEKNHVDLPVTEDIELGDFLRSLCEKVRATAALLTPPGWIEKYDAGYNAAQWQTLKNAVSQQPAIQTTPFTPPQSAGLAQGVGGGSAGFLSGSGNLLGPTK